METDWKEDDERTVDDLRWWIDRQKARAVRIMESYNIPPPPPGINDVEFIKYVDDYVSANLVLH